MSAVPPRASVHPADAERTPERAALLIDDSRLDQLNTRSLLLGSRAGFTRLDWIPDWPGVEPALDGRHYDLYLIDMQLGPTSGLDVIRELRRYGILEPIIALTGRSDDAIDRACTEAGASDFLVKGEVDRRALERSIRYAERQAAVHRELERLNGALERRATAENDQARLMRFAIEQSSDATFITKVGATLNDHVVVYVNAALCQRVRRRAGELLGSSIDALVDARESATGGMLERVINGRGAYSGDVGLVASGDAQMVAMRAMPLRSTADDVTHYVWTCRDVAQATESPASLRRRERFEMIGQITGGLAHDLNERLTSVIGNLDLVSRKQADEPTTKLLDAASRAAEDLAAQTGLLVALANGGDGRDVDLTTMLPALLPLIRHAVGRLVRIEYRPPAEPLWPVAVEAGRLRLALLALAAWTRHDSARDLELVARNVPAEQVVDGPACVLDGRPDRGADHVAIGFAESLRSTAPADAESRDADDATLAFRRVERLVHDAHGMLVVEGDAGAGRVTTIYLRRVR